MSILAENLNDLAGIIHERNKEKGFYQGKKNIGEMIALMHSELSEALEADRKGRYVPNPYVELRFEALHSDDEGFKDFYESAIKGTFDEEMADIVIRVLDMCAFKGIDIQTHIEAKMRYNEMREFMHGKRY